MTATIAAISEHEASQSGLVSFLADQILTARETLLRDRYNRRAKGYIENSKKFGWGMAPKLVARLLANAPHLDSQFEIAALDLGVGRGEIGVRLKEINPRIHVIGVDLSDEMVRYAKADEFIDEGVVGSFTDLSWCPDDSQDVITSCGVVELLENEQALPPVLRQVARVGRPGAPVAISFVPKMDNYLGPKADTMYDPEWIREQFQAANIEVLEISPVPDAWLYNGVVPVQNNILIGRVGGTALDR